MTKVADIACIEYITEKMDGNCYLPQGTTIHDDIDGYMMMEHENWFTKDFSSFICIQFTDSYIAIPYAYNNGGYANTKQLVTFAKRLYKRYTIKDKKPILYTGLKNHFPNHSDDLGYNLWQLKA